METGVYRITNIVSNKIYIGSTAMSFKQRWATHRNTLKKNKGSLYLQHAWNKYGKESFIFEVIERCSPELVIDREQYWLDFYKPYDHSIGYNINPKAESRLGSTVPYEQRKYKYDTIYCFDLKGNLICSYPSAKEIREAGFNYEAIIDSIIGPKKSHANLLWSNVLTIKPFTREPKARGYRFKLSKPRKSSSRPTIELPIVQVYNNTPVKIWKSITAAAEYLGGQRTNIVAVLKGKRLTACGFQWSYI